MNQQIKRKWVKALRSGRYKQGDTFLKSKSRYCCLGVLRELAPELFRDCTSETFLKDSADGYLVLDKKIQGELSVLNDEGVPFDMIAGLIDEAL